MDQWVQSEPGLSMRAAGWGVRQAPDCKGTLSNLGERRLEARAESSEFANQDVG
jgi:hypothetical protein